MVELIMGLVITTLVVGALAAVSLAVSSGWKQMFPPVNTSSSAPAPVAAQSPSVSAIQAMLRMQNVLRQARLVAFVRGGSITGSATPGAAVVLWKGDDNADGLIQFSEVTLIEHNVPDKALNLYTVQFPREWSEADKAAHDFTVAYSLLSSASAPQDFKALQYVQARPLARDVTGATISVQDAGGGPRPCVQFSLKLMRGVTSIVQEGSATLRAPGGAP